MLNLYYVCIYIMYRCKFMTSDNVFCGICRFVALSVVGRTVKKILNIFSDRQEGDSAKHPTTTRQAPDWGR